jgi:hypothetical protein
MQAGDRHLWLLLCTGVRKEISSIAAHADADAKTARRIPAHATAQNNRHTF